MKKIIAIIVFALALVSAVVTTAFADTGDDTASEDAVEQLRNGELGKDAELGEAPKVDSEGEVELGPANQGENPNAPEQEDEDTELAPAWQGPNPNVTTSEELPEAGAPTLALVMLALMFSAFGGVLLRKT